MSFHLGSSPHRGMINIDRPLWPLRDRVFRGVDMHAGNLPGREGRGERESGASLGSKFHGQDSSTRGSLCHPTPPLTAHAAERAYIQNSRNSPTIPPHNSSIPAAHAPPGPLPQNPPRTQCGTLPPPPPPAPTCRSPPACRSHPGGCGATARTIPGPGRTVRPAARKRGSDAQRIECCAAGCTESAQESPSFRAHPAPHMARRGACVHSK